MRKNFWAMTSVVLLVVLVSILIPGVVIAQDPSSETSRALSVFEQVFRYVEKNYVDELDSQVLLEGALKGLFDSLDDPHSAYLTDTSLRGLNDTTSGKFGGVGMYITKEQRAEGEDEFIRVIAPIAETPAERLGIRSNDLIIEIEDVSTKDFTIDETVRQLRGPVGKDVRVKIRRGTYEFPISITRTVIEVPTIRHARIPNTDIGYIRIIQFTPFTAKRVREAVAEFETEGYHALIVDVRQNPGGLLSSVVDVSDLFLSGGIIVGTSGRDRRQNQIFNATKNIFVPMNVSVVVLIDEGSASASEIFAGALGDRGRAVVIGQKSYGKGSVQQIKPIGDGAFRLTMSRYYTPNGVYIDKIGVIPDILSEPELLTEEQTADIVELLSSRQVEEFVGNRVTIEDEEVDRFILEIVRTTSLAYNMVEKLVRDALLRANNTISVFDLEFDTTLQRAIQHLTS